tara:strand:+ start:2978 stop:3184 length:207 start_codon:yes stop_codon:yes gene_type:complete
MKAIVAFCVCCGANSREREREREKPLLSSLSKKKKTIFGCLFRVFGLLGFKKMSKENKNFEEEKRSLF